MDKKHETEVKELRGRSGELRCSGCKCNHPISAFGVKRSIKRGYQTLCRVAMAKAQAKHYEANKAVILEKRAKHYTKNSAAILEKQARYGKTDKGRAVKAKYAAKLKEQAFNIIGHTCAHGHLGGCEGPLTIDHIVPVIRRRRTGYTSSAPGIYRWIVDNPEDAYKRLQPLCARHQLAKGDMPDDEARAKWAARHPLTQGMYDGIIDKVA
ncbi:MAG: hypothetical protein AMXMBFR67_26810 [Nitrospira sp.]